MSAQVWTLAHGAGATTQALLALLILLRGMPGRTGLVLAGAAALTALWAAVEATIPFGASETLADALQLLAALGWCGFALHIYFHAVPAGASPRRLFAVLAVVAVGLAGLGGFAGMPPAGEIGLADPGVTARLFVPLLTLMLTENVYHATPPEMRWHVKPACLAVAAIAIFDLVLFADAVLFRRVSPLLLLGRPVVAVLAAPLLAVAAARVRAWGIDIHVSRDVVFHGATLMGSGIFLLALAAVAEAFSRFAAGWGPLFEVVLLCAGALALVAMLSSGAVRGWLRRSVAENFFSNRYDWRREWTRCIASLALSDAYEPLPVRVIRTLAAVVDSPSGALFLPDPADEPDGAGALRWAASWNMPTNIPMGALSVPAADPLLARFADGTHVLDAAELRGEPAARALAAELPGVWLAAPLSHRGTLAGFVLLSRPPVGFHLDAEARDLLHILGRQAGAVVAEQRMAESLATARELRDYGRRFAFVAHDIKNVSNQLSLLLANAERHLENPAFRRDMVETVRAAVTRINLLLARLQAPAARSADTGKSAVADPGMVSVAARLGGLTDRYARTCGAPVQFDVAAAEVAGETAAPSGAAVAMSAEAFDAAVAHLLDNAIEASAPGAPVRVTLALETDRVLIDIADTGPGMTAEFVRDTLFRPLRSGKPAGSGLGAYQARELARAAGGEVEVFSLPGRGTVMRLVLPLLATSEMLCEAAP